MFQYINRSGPLSEHDAVFVFRQIMCAIEYCHSFNICHRDLKPENVLLSDMGEVKIIDFGMAALHQNDAKLRTSCGSPHYAAPELLRSKTYRGDKADVWSMGVIFYAMLAQKLPFDDPHLPTMLSKAKKGVYIMPKYFSPEAQDFVRRMLQIDPDKRISLREMWEHPLIKQYDDQEGYEHQHDQPEGFNTKATDAPIHPGDMDPLVVRQLRAMWHSTDEEDLKVKLASKEPNEQKLFYHLLTSHRDRQLENYDPQLTHSASDYHHLRPQAWATRVSTRQFKNPGRSASRFTVISTVADTDAGGTVRSYDPYHASRNMATRQASHAKITIHRGSDTGSVRSGSVPSRMGTGSTGARKRFNPSLRSRTVSAQSPRSSMSSLRSSRQGTTGLLVVKSRYKRNVDFTSIRKNPEQPRRSSVDKQLTASASIAGDGSTYGRDNPSPQKRIKREHVSHNESAHKITSLHGDTTVWPEEEIAQFSDSIARDCDDAFRTSLIVSSSDVADQSRREGTPFTVDFGTPSIQVTPSSG